MWHGKGKNVKVLILYFLTSLGCSQLVFRSADVQLHISVGEMRAEQIELLEGNW